MSIVILKAKSPYKTDCGDVVCDLLGHDCTNYIESDEVIGTEKIVPICLFNPNPWKALQGLEVEARPLISNYVCPYTKYEFFSVVPVALLLFKGDVQSYPKQPWFDYEFLFDWEWHKKMIKDITEPYPIQKLLLGSGYTNSWGVRDGHGRLIQRKVMMSNGDGLLVSFWEWYNK